MENKNETAGWASQEFGEIDLGDRRLKDRLVKLADKLASSPESPINQACGDWANTKAAYRFFQNEDVNEKTILQSHVSNTLERAKELGTILAIQDTSYFNFTDHKKTTGLGMISKYSTKNLKMNTNAGLAMHTSFAVNLDGLPLGILDQTIYARKSLQEGKRNTKFTPIEDKESIRWLNALKQTNEIALSSQVRVVTVCDREGDFYELFEYGNRLQAPLLVRAATDRNINKHGPYWKGKFEKLWSTVQALQSSGMIEVEIPARDQKPARKAHLETRFGSITMNPPRQHIRKLTEQLPDINLYAVYVIEKNPPVGEEALEWMLLTDLQVTSFEEAKEKVAWYCLRWRIEVFHKILKSGLKVEQCRLQSADRLIRYLTIMSIIAWRIYWLTLIARTDPELPCTAFVADEEWKVLYSKIKKTKSFPKKPPRVREVVRWIASLGGFLGRKGDGEPGIMTLWRGWKRLCDLSEGWILALS
jgi:hypothetical protein